MIRRDFLKSLGAAFAAAVEIGSVLTPPLSGKIVAVPGEEPQGPEFLLKSVRVRHRFDPNGQTKRTVEIHIQAKEKLTGDEVAEWCRGVVGELRPPKGFRVVSASYTVDLAGRELSGKVEMLEVIETPRCILGK